MIRGAVPVALLNSRLVCEVVDVLLLDLDDLSAPALSLISQVRCAQPPIALAVCTDGVAFAPELLQAGVGSLLTLTEAPDLLVPTLHAVQVGRHFLSPAVATALLGMDRKTLTRAELRVVALLAEGLSTAGIAQEMGIYRRSVQNLHHDALAQAGLSPASPARGLVPALCCGVIGG